jgi:HPt (histidine-containing phosphotransfer) domain-containing protein
MTFRYIDPSYLDSVANGDLQLISELVEMFSTQVQEIYNEMNKKLAEGDYMSLGLLAHKAKSSVAILGMNDLASVLKTLEMKAKQGEKDEKYSDYIRKYHDDSVMAVMELKELIISRSGK